MNKFSNTSGAKVKVDFTQSIGQTKHGIVEATIDFQCRMIENVPGLVYVKFVPKGKRKEVSIAIHQDYIKLI